MRPANNRTNDAFLRADGLPAAARRHLQRLGRQARSLAEMYRTVADDVHRGETISPAAEWLLDTFHLITNEARTVHHDLPPGYYRRLPHVTGSESSRLEAMAEDLIRHSDRRLDADRSRCWGSARHGRSRWTDCAQRHSGPHTRVSR